MEQPSLLEQTIHHWGGFKIFCEIDGMLARYLASLDQYDYTIVHRKGDHHRNADGMSRIPARKFPRDDCPQCTHQVNPVSILILGVASQGTGDRPALVMEPDSDPVGLDGGGP